MRGEDLLIFFHFCSCFGLVWFGYTLEVLQWPPGPTRALSVPYDTNTNPAAPMPAIDAWSNHLRPGTLKYRNREWVLLSSSKPATSRVSPSSAPMPYKPRYRDTIKGSWDLRVLSGTRKASPSRKPGNPTGARYNDLTFVFFQSRGASPERIWNSYSNLSSPIWGQVVGCRQPKHHQ